MLENLKDQIVEQLKSKPECRNSDITLMIEIWKVYYFEKLFDVNVAGRKGEDQGRDYIWQPAVELRKLYDLPRDDNIKRIRAKLQEEALERIESGKVKGDEQFYLPTSWEVAHQRQIQSAIWTKALGYFRTPLRQTEQLPRPVGMIGFSKVAANKFLVNGAKGKKYQVEINEYGFVSCECESYRYSLKKVCKHTQEIKSYLLKVAKQEAAKHQTNLF